MIRVRERIASRFVQNVLLIAGGAAFAQLLTVVLAPVITRMYAPEEYGVISLFTAMLGALGFLGSMNYEMAIPIAERDEKAINVLALSVMVSLVSMIAVTLILNVAGRRLLVLLNGELLEPFVYMIPVSMLLVTGQSVLTQWTYRQRNLAPITTANISQSMTQNIVSIAIGFAGGGAVGLLLGRILGQSAGVAVLAWPLGKAGHRLLEHVESQEILQAARQYVRYPVYTTPRRYLGDATLSMPALLMASLYGTRTVGFFGLAYSVIQLPMNVVGGAISSAYYAECAALRDTDPTRVKVLSARLLRVLAAAGLAPLLALMVFGPQLFAFFFGAGWAEAGTYAGLLSVAVFCRFIFKPVSNIFDVFEKQRTALWIYVFWFFLTVAVFAVSSSLELSSRWAVGMYSIATACIYFTQYLAARRILNEACATTGARSSPALGGRPEC